MADVVGRRGPVDDGIMVLLVVAALMLIAWIVLSFGSDDEWRCRG